MCPFLLEIYIELFTCEILCWVGDLKYSTEKKKKKGTGVNEIKLKCFILSTMFTFAIKTLFCFVSFKIELFSGQKS